MMSARDYQLYYMQYCPVALVVSMNHHNDLESLYASMDVALTCVIIYGIYIYTIVVIGLPSNHFFIALIAQLIHASIAVLPQD